MRVISLCFGLILLSSAWSNGQEISVALGADEVALNQYFTISITVSNDKIKAYSPFPEIHGFTKRGTSSSSNTSFVNGQVSSSHSITQNYQATAQGSFELKAFQIKVNNQTLTVKGKKIRVTEPAQQQRRSTFFQNDPFDNFFGRRASKSVEYTNVKADAFLALSTSKREVYVGEGFTATLAFYVASTNRADIRFFDLGNQMTEIVKKLKPEFCWEESFNVESVNGESVTINGKDFTKYVVYQTAFFPLNIQDIKFPAVNLELIKYDVAKNPSFFGRNRQENRQSFRSQPKTVVVKELPQHPLMERVAVGDYRLRERLETPELQTGQSFDYSFDVIGTGNISAIAAPSLPEDGNFDFYSPNTQQNINRSNGRIGGGKSFLYHGIPNEPGRYNMGDYFSWVFFNTRTNQYDTLKSELMVKVTGESRKNEYISNDISAFYNRITNENNELRSLNPDRFVQLLSNVCIVILFGLTTFMLFRKV